jgi:hypothetical protein
MLYDDGAGQETAPAPARSTEMFTTTFRNGSEQSYRYTRSVDGREAWTPRGNNGPKTEMVARNDWPCKFTDCGDRTVVAGRTVIVKRDGKWGHKDCPKVERVAAKSAAQQAMDDDRMMAELEAAGDRAGTMRDNVAKAAARQAMEMSPEDRADALLAEYEASLRAKNVANLQVGTYRVEFSGKADTDSFNLKITADRKNAGSFYFKSAESWEGVGRIWSDGRIQLWSQTNLTADEQKRAQEALEILLGAERMGKYGEAYARETGACFRCGRELKVEDSIDRGLGKTCAMKVEAGY